MKYKILISVVLLFILFSCSRYKLEKFEQDKNAFEIYHESVSSLDSGKVSLALEKIKQAINLNPNFAQFYLQRGLIYFEKGEIDSAMQRAIAVMKMRGSNHQKEICRFEIKKGGLKIGSPFTGREGILTGATRRIA